MAFLSSLCNAVASKIFGQLWQTFKRHRFEHHVTIAYGIVEFSPKEIRTPHVFEKKLHIGPYRIAPPPRPSTRLRWLDFALLQMNDFGFADHTVKYKGKPIGTIHVNPAKTEGLWCVTISRRDGTPVRDYAQYLSAPSSDVFTHGILRALQALKDQIGT